jgi:hypothetical protein
VSDRSQRVSDHRISQALNGVASSAELALEREGITEEASSLLRRAQFVVERVRATLEEIEPELIPLQQLDQTAVALDNAKGQIDSFNTNGDEGHLSNADNQVDAALVHVASLPPPPQSEEGQAAARAVKRFAERIRSTESSLRTTLQRLSSRAQLQSEAIDAEEENLKRISQTADEQVAKIGQEADAKLAELRSEIDNQKARLDDAIAQHQSGFAEEQTRRLQQFNEAQQAREAEFKERTEKTLNEAQSNMSASRTEAEAVLEQLRDHETRAARIVGVTAASGTAGAYLDEANEQKGAADLWRRIALGIAAILFAGTLLATAISPPKTDASIEEILVFASLRLPVASVIAGAFFYAMGQSGQHRDREQRAKRLAMQLTAFRPFLSELADEQIPGELTKAADRFFPGDHASTPGDVKQ